MGPDSISGYLTCEHIIHDSTFWLEEFDGENATAYFKKNPVDSATTLVDSVSINGFEMEVDGDNLGYLTGNENLSLDASAIWHVVGNSYIPSFTYNHSVSYPTITAILPDTIDKTTGLTFNINITGADSFAISIPDSLGMYVSKIFSATSTSQSFSSSELASLKAGAVNAEYSIEAVKSTPATFGGKKFLFTKITQRIHWAWIK
jgi:hypothetical protein